MSDTTTDPKSPQLLDRVVIRFAGDSGDGMQLAGDRFTTTSALLGNDLATFPDFPAEIRAPAGTLAGVSAFQVHISDHDISTPGDSPNVLVAMNPAALKANLDALPKGATIIVNVDAFEERNLAKAGYETNPLARRLAVGLHRLRGPDDLDHHRGVQGRRGQARDAERSKNFFALGLISWLYTRPIEATIEWIEREVRRQAPGHGGQPPGLQGRLPLRGDRRAVRVLLRGASRPRSSPGEYVNITGNTATAWGLIVAVDPERAAALPRHLPDHPGLGHPPRAVQAQAVRGADLPGRGRDLRHRRRPRRRLRRGAGRDHHLGPGHRPQVGDHGPGHQPRAPAADHRHPARRALHRPADQDRAGRPAPRHVRPSRRGPAAHRGGQDAVALLRGHARGGPAGRQVPHAGDPALRRLPGQRHRAVAAARPGRPARHRPRLRHRAQPHRCRRQRGVLALRPGRRDAGPTLGPARRGRPRAPHRRPREGGRLGQRRLRRRPTTSG